MLRGCCGRSGRGSASRGTPADAVRRAGGLDGIDVDVLVTVSVMRSRDIQRTILGKTSGADADHLASIMRGLPPLTCVLYSKQFARFVRVTIEPYFERQPPT